MLVPPVHRACVTRIRAGTATISRGLPGTDVTCNTSVYPTPSCGTTTHHPTHPASRHIRIAHHTRAKNPGEQNTAPLLSLRFRTTASLLRTSYLVLGLRHSRTSPSKPSLPRRSLPGSATSYFIPRPSPTSVLPLPSPPDTASSPIFGWTSRQPRDRLPPWKSTHTPP